MGNDEESKLWPKNQFPLEAEKLFNFVKSVADEKTNVQIAKIEREYETAKRIAESNGDYGSLLDMPVTVLDGKLGELCMSRMLSDHKFPLAYAWPSLLAVASALVPRYSEKQRVNLFAALVGPVHSGKSQAIEWAQNLLAIKEPDLLEIMAGSGEALVRRCKDAKGTARLFSPDELGHLLEKAKIEHSSFSYVLNKAFYSSKFEVLMGRKEAAIFNASLSIIGGLLDDRFEDLFNSATTGGLYDRFMFGACPGNFIGSYVPFDEVVTEYNLERVYVHEEVWRCKDRWLEEDRELEPRVAEIAIRAAIVCASFDGRTILRAADLSAARSFAEYQKRIRRLLKPNEGETVEGKLALKLLAHLSRLNGKYCKQRELLDKTGAYRFGPSVVKRTMDVLHANNDIEILKNSRPVLVRKIIDEEIEDD
jgi:hypothetical protein